MFLLFPSLLICYSDQRQVQLCAPQDQANFPILAPQGQGHRQGLGHPVVARCDDLDSLFEEEFSVDLDNEAVLNDKTGSIRDLGQGCRIL